MKIILALYLIFLSSCALDTGECKANHYQTHTNYDVKATLTTPNGIKVDTTGQSVSLDLIDRITNETEQCLSNEFPEGKLPQDIIVSANCISERFHPLNYECLEIKIPDDWLYSCDGTQQVLKDEAPQYLCDAKGLKNSDCPCRWRAAIQNDHIIITTPSLYMYKDPLVRLITGCNNPWGHELLAKCAMPSIPKLPD